MSETVMVVDDDPAVREVFTVYLERNGYQVLAAGGGTECLDLLKTEIPDLILLDMMMEPMDGWDALFAIQNDPGTARIPVIVVTGKHPTHPDILRYGGYIEDFIMKPVDFRVIAGSIRLAIDRNKNVQVEAERKEREGHDPVLVAEYIRLGRMVRIARTLLSRFRTLKWADTALLERQERELVRLHAKIGFPDHFLTSDPMQV